jgi:hypothetical protein
MNQTGTYSYLIRHLVYQSDIIILFALFLATIIFYAYFYKNYSPFRSNKRFHPVRIGFPMTIAGFFIFSFLTPAINKNFPQKESGSGVLSKINKADTINIFDLKEAIKLATDWNYMENQRPFQRIDSTDLVKDREFDDSVYKIMRETEIIYRINQAKKIAFPFFLFMLIVTGCFSGFLIHFNKFRILRISAVFLLIAVPFSCMIYAIEIQAYLGRFPPEILLLPIPLFWLIPVSFLIYGWKKITAEWEFFK